MTTLVNGRYPLSKPEGLYVPDPNNPPPYGTSTWTRPACYGCGPNRRCPTCMRVDAVMADWDAQARATGVQPVVLEPVQLELFSDEPPEVSTDAADA